MRRKGLAALLTFGLVGSLYLSLQPNSSSQLEYREPIHDTITLTEHLDGRKEITHTIRDSFFAIPYTSSRETFIDFDGDGKVDRRETMSRPCSLIYLRWIHRPLVIPHFEFRHDVDSREPYCKAFGSDSYWYSDQEFARDKSRLTRER